MWRNHNIVSLISYFFLVSIWFLYKCPISNGRLSPLRIDFNLWIKRVGKCFVELSVWMSGLFMATADFGWFFERIFTFKFFSLIDVNGVLAKVLWQIRWVNETEITKRFCSHFRWWPTKHKKKENEFGLIGPDGRSVHCNCWTAHVSLNHISALPNIFERFLTIHQHFSTNLFFFF